MLDFSALPADGPVFIDFEASSLSDESWPVEIGLSWLPELAAGVQPIVTSTLIRPARGWTDWNFASERVHGIQRRALAEAPRPRDISRALDALAGRLLLSDAPVWETKWLWRLRGPRDPKLPVRDCFRWIEANLPGPLVDQVHEALRRIPTPHRAGPDAARYPLAISRAMTRRGWANLDGAVEAP